MLRSLRGVAKDFKELEHDAKKLEKDLKHKSHKGAKKHL